MTIYRTWADMPTLLGDLMTREWAGVVADAVADGGPARPSSASSTAIVGTVRQLRENELFVRIVELDPELILPYLFSRRGRSQDADPRRSPPTRSRDGQAAGEVRAGNPVADRPGAAARRPRLRALRAHDGRRRRHRGRARRRARRPCSPRTLAP